MADIERLVRRWLDAGVIDEPTAERIRQHELTRRIKDKGERPGIFEALIYVGLAVIGVGAFVLGILVWDDLGAVPRIVLIGLPGIAAIGLGQYLRNVDEPGLQRGGSIAWVLGAALLAGCAAVIAAEADAGSLNTVLAASLVGVVATAVLWYLLPWHPQLVAFGVATGWIAFAIALRSDHEGPAVFAGVLTPLAVAWIVLTELGWLTPRLTARALGGLGLATGAYLLGVDPNAPGVLEVVTFVAGVGLIALSIVRASFAYMAFGVGVLFIGLVTFTLQRIPNPELGALVLILSGVLLVAAVIVLARWRPWAAQQAE